MILCFTRFAGKKAWGMSYVVTCLYGKFTKPNSTGCNTLSQHSRKIWLYSLYKAHICSVTATLTSSPIERNWHSYTGGLKSWKSPQIFYFYCYVTLKIFLRKLTRTIYTHLQYHKQVKCITYTTIQTVFKIEHNFKIMHNFDLERWHNFRHIHFLHTLEQTVVVKSIRKQVLHNVLHKDRGIICSFLSFFAVCLRIWITDICTKTFNTKFY